MLTEMQGGPPGMPSFTNLTLARIWEVRLFFLSDVIFFKAVLCRIFSYGTLFVLTALFSSFFCFSFFSQAAEYNAALCIDWLTCMAPKNRMVFVYFLFVTS